jgi:prepilin-type N-terminal cleavage/methylation domain-containing protein
MSHRSRHGFTLVELLVVITIIGILIALLLPAVQAAREAARRAQCSNNLKQSGLAIHGYHSLFGMVPISVGDRNKPPASGKGWIVSILPQLEQQTLFDQFVPGFAGDCETGTGIRRPECANAMKTRLPMLECPSDPSVQKVSTVQPQWENIEVAQTSYEGVIGDNTVGLGSSPTPPTFDSGVPDCHAWPTCRGMIFRCSSEAPVRFDMVTDGLSNTLMVGEDVPEYNYHSAAYYANGDWSGCNVPLNYMPDPPTPANWWDALSFRSRHPGGAYFCLADGGVSFLGERIDYKLYLALSTRNVGELVQMP